MLLQERIEELGSLILNIKNDKIELIGFMSEDRLLSYYIDNVKCHLSHGIYNKEPFDLAYLNDNSLCIIQENNIEVARYKYVPLKKGTLKYKDPADMKNKSKIYTLRLCEYTEKYSFVESTRSMLFDTKDSLTSFLINEYNIDPSTIIE